MQTTANTSWHQSAAFAYCLPFAIYIAFLMIESLGLSLVGGSADWRWLYGVKVGCVALALAIYWRRYEDLARAHLPNAGWLILAVAAGLLVLVLWVSLTMPWAVIGASSGFDPRGSDGGMNWALTVTRALGATLVVPIMEELFWRSFVMRWIEQLEFWRVTPRRVGAKALFISAIVFGFEHSLWLAGIVAGLVYGWLYIRSGNLWVPVLAHAVTNGGLAVWVVLNQQWQFW